MIVQSIAVILATAGSLVGVFAVYQLVLAIAAVFHRPHSGGEPRSRLVVLVPAHDEAALIARCVESLRSQRYPTHLYSIVVIADNCTDETASLAETAGAKALVRDQPEARGKGHALRWGLETVLRGTPPPDGVVVVDADSRAEPGFLAALVRPFERGAEAVQGESLLMADGAPAHAALRAAAFLLVNHVRPRGRAVFGAPATLAGNGMLFSRRLLLEQPWSAFTSAEDLEYSVALRLAGVRPVFARGAVLHSPAAPSPEAAVQQQLRWEGGKVHVARTQIPRLVATAMKERRPGLLETAFELAVPPLGLLGAAAVAGTVASGVAVLLGVPSWALVPWLVALAAIPLYVLVGLLVAHAPASAYRALARAPVLLLPKILSARRLLAFRADTWVRTKRDDSGNAK